MKILVVDDQRSARRVLKQMLASLDALARSQLSRSIIRTFALLLATCIGALSNENAPEG